VIFVTAFDQYAIEAFKLHALDYILKPIDEEAFVEVCAAYNR
jgi:two-component system LytT family response regulator